MLIVKSAVIALLSFCLVFVCVSGIAHRARAPFDVAPVITDAPVIAALQSDPRDETSIAVSRANDKIIVGASKLLDSVDQPLGRTNTRVAYYYSSDGGLTWGNGALGLETPQKTWGRASDPSVVSDLNGNFYLCVLMLDNLSQDSSIYVFKSTDGGHTWNNPIPVVTDIGNAAGPNLADKCYITVDAVPTSPFKNTLYAIWASTEPNRTVILTNHLRPGETAFSEPKTISHNGNMRGPSITTGPNGELYCAWEGIGNPRVILFNASTDGGETFLPAEAAPGRDFKTHSFVGAINEGDVPGHIIRPIRRSNSFPVIDVDRSSGPNRGMIYIAYAETTNGIDSDVFVKKLTPPNGQRPDVSLPVKVNNDGPGADQFFPWLSVDPKDGSVEVAFYDRRDNPGGNIINLYLARSTDGGASYGANMKISSVGSDALIQSDVLGGNASQIGIGDYIGLQALGGKAYALWTDTRRSKQEIFFGKVDFEPSSGGGGGGGGGGNNGPPNDSCQTPRVISSLPFQDEINTANAAVAPDDPVSCSGSQDKNTVWYSITPSANSVYGIDTNASDYDTTISVYTGACGALTRVACNDDFNNSPANKNRALLVFQAQAGVAYLIEASGKGGGGALRLRVGNPTITNVEFTKGPDGEKSLRITGAGFADGSAVVSVNKDGEITALPTTFFAGEKQGDGTVTVIFGTKKKLKKLVKPDRTIIVSVESPAGSGRVSNQFAFSR
jgi:hypothetical protein